MKMTRRDKAGHPGTNGKTSRLTETARRDGTGHTPKGCPDVPPCLLADYASLNEKDFSTALQRISNLGELEGLANRRKILNAPQLLRWSERQREQIIERKFELQKEKAK